MSSQLTNLVPVFDRQNYGQWVKAIKVFLMSQGLWGYTDGSIPQPGPGAPAEEIATWQRSSTFDILKCKHDFILNQCAKCHEKTSTMWLLDSGALGHFSNNRSDFIHYTPLSKMNRIPVQTASTPTFIEGYGTVLLQHKLNGSLVTPWIHPVLHIPNMSTWLLSMGEFLQQGMQVEGDLQQIALLYKNQPFIQCKPLFRGQTLLWLDVTSTMVEAQYIEKPIV